MSVPTPYRNQAIALATMHAKERAIEKPFARFLGAKIIVTDGIDTDAFGTFTGEIPRSGTMLATANAKALAAVERTGLPRGLGSEGSFGPHPSLPFVSAGMEILAFVDRNENFAIHEMVVTHRTNFGSYACSPQDDIVAFLQQVKFPTHAVVVRPNASAAPRFEKAVQDLETLRTSIARCAAESEDRLALVTTDMRAHLNPTRMASIRALSSRLARRLACPCPACGCAGFGIVDVQRGLPCAWCSEPTHLVKAEIHRCSRCTFERMVPIKNREAADPGQCSNCNP